MCFAKIAMQTSKTTHLQVLLKNRGAIFMAILVVARKRHQGFYNPMAILQIAISWLFLNWVFPWRCSCLFRIFYSTKGWPSDNYRIGIKPQFNKNVDISVLVGVFLNFRGWSRSSVVL